MVPLPHQLYALNRAVSRDRIRYLLADEVGLGKTIEAGLILRELKLRGMAKRVLVVLRNHILRRIPRFSLQALVWGSLTLSAAYVVYRQRDPWILEREELLSRHLYAGIDSSGVVHARCSGLPMV